MNLLYTKRNIQQYIVIRVFQSSRDLSIRSNTVSALSIPILLSNIVLHSASLIPCAFELDISSINNVH